MLLIIVLYALFAATFSLGKLILGYTQPIFLVGSRMTIAGIIILGYLWLTDRDSMRFSKKNIPLYLQMIIFTIYINYLLRYWGLNYISSSKACLLYNLGPFVTYLLSYLLYGEKVTYKKVIGLFIGFIGLVPLVTKSACAVTEPTNCVMWPLPELAMLLATSAASYGWLITHRLIKEKKYSPIYLNGISMTCGGLLALMTSFIFETGKPFVTDIMPFIGILAIIILVSNLMGHNLYGNLLRTYSPTMIAFASFLCPIFAALYGWLFLHESITWRFAASSCVVFCGLALFYYDELGKQPAKKRAKALDSVTPPSLEEYEL